ncbi:hypothetical protein DFR86_02290 [Acidianus sulfidivorans JP7]|uniref:Uncharacterized protein n=1 Tax=Acidianus sulfidivorans JP7 TaxID=619593 RepID=A0A2U9IKI9_9CREN|nr:hypothetical protein [Acidianus sulfidivorans]AWR96496.1 hypothetical protein DFR86_02290 [Acidianus sulfidivorans JP7]
MKLSFSALEKIRRMPNYSVVEDGENIIISYLTPSASEASGSEENEELSRIIIITGKKLNNYIEIQNAEIRTEDNKLVRKMNLDELQLWLEYLE